jgi:hypothetical protein
MSTTSKTTSNLPGTHLALVEGTTGAATQIDNPNAQLPDPGATGTGTGKLVRQGNSKYVNPA